MATAIRHKYKRKSHPQTTKPQKDYLLQKFKPDEFKLPAQHLIKFKLSDKVNLRDALNSLLIKFSKAPFHIYDRHNIFTIHDNLELYLFKLEENEISSKSFSQPPLYNNLATLYPRSSNSTALKEERYFAQKAISLTIFGIDPPSCQMIE